MDEGTEGEDGKTDSGRGMRQVIRDVPYPSHQLQYILKFPVMAKFIRPNNIISIASDIGFSISQEGITNGGGENPIAPHRVNIF